MFNFQDLNSKPLIFWMFFSSSTKLPTWKSYIENFTYSWSKTD